MRYLSIIVIVAACGIAANSRCAGQSGEDGTAIRAVRARQESTKTLMIRYKRVDIVAKGGESEGMGPALKPSVPVPDEETRLESVNRLVLDGVKIRHESNHPAWLMPAGKLQDISQIAFFNGSAAKVFFPKGMSNDGKPEGIIERESQLTDIKSFVLAPITVIFRGLDPAVCTPPFDSLKRSGATLPVGGTTCDEYTIDYRDNAATIYWLDPKKGYVPLRIRAQQQGRVTMQTDIAYERNEAGEWMPASWVCNQFFSSGSVKKATTVQVLELRVNDRQPADQFDVPFPPGTRVHDGKTGKMYRVETGDRTVELSWITGEDLSGPIAQPDQPWYRRHQWLIAAAILLCIASLLLYVWGRRQRMRQH